jgi:hypothetical protein
MQAGVAVHANLRFPCFNPVTTYNKASDLESYSIVL